MNDCTICHDIQRGRLAERGNERLCKECRPYWDYWHSLSDEEKRAEIRSMDAYANQCERV